jgi:hypothetical protein
MKLRTLFLVLVLFPLALFTVQAQKNVSPGEALKNVKATFNKVKDYTAELSVSFKDLGMKIPPMKAKVYFKQPDKIHLESEGFAMLPRDIMTLNPNAFDETMWDLVIQGTEDVQGVQCIKLKMLAKSDTMRIQRATLFIDPAKWILRKLASDPAQGAAAEAVFTYQTIDGRYELPSEIRITMSGAMMRRGKKPMKDVKPAEDDHSPKGEVLVKYANYRVNKGISDSVFKEKQK